LHAKNKVKADAMKTYTAKPVEVEHKWVVIDAEGAVVGRLAAFVATRLRGKHRPDFTPNIDTGDHVVVINADKVVFTGRKYQDKRYYRHTGHPGGIKETSPRKIMEGRFPERVLEAAIKRMLPKDSPLARKQFAKLRVYAGAEHPHEAQSPEVVDFVSLNSKNARS
jgi:large subunit ribosomal protein L13